MTFPVLRLADSPRIQAPLSPGDDYRADQRTRRSTSSSVLRWNSRNSGIYLRSPEARVSPSRATDDEFLAHKPTLRQKLGRFLVEGRFSTSSTCLTPQRHRLGHGIQQAGAINPRTSLATQPKPHAAARSYAFAAPYPLVVPKDRYYLLQSARICSHHKDCTVYPAECTDHTGP